MMFTILLLAVLGTLIIRTYGVPCPKEMDDIDLSGTHSQEKADEFGAFILFGAFVLLLCGAVADVVGWLS